MNFLLHLLCFTEFHFLISKFVYPLSIFLYDRTLYPFLSVISSAAGQFILKVIIYFEYESLKQFKISCNSGTAVTNRQSEDKTTFESDGKVKMSCLKPTTYNCEHIRI